MEALEAILATLAAVEAVLIYWLAKYAWKLERRLEINKRQAAKLIGSCGVAIGALRKELENKERAQNLH